MTTSTPGPCRLGRLAGAAALALSLLLSGCQADRPAPAPSIPAATRPAGDSAGEQPVPRPDASAPEDALPIPAVSITGRVKTVSADARLITFEQQSEGLDRVALSSDTRIATAGGQSLTPADLRPGMVVRASGPPAGGIVRASEVTVLGSRG